MYFVSQNCCIEKGNQQNLEETVQPILRKTDQKLCYPQLFQQIERLLLPFIHLI